MTKRDHRYYGSTWRCPATGGKHDYQLESDDIYPHGYIKCTECNAGEPLPTKLKSTPLRFPKIEPEVIDEWHPGARD